MTAVLKLQVCLKGGLPELRPAQDAVTPSAPKPLEATKANPNC